MNPISYKQTLGLEGLFEHGGCDPAPIPSVGNWEWDFITGAVTWSGGLFQLFGFAPGTVQPSFELWASRLHPDDRARTEAVALAAQTAGGLINHEFRILRVDGTVRWLANKGEVFADASGAQSWASGVLLDITELREAQIELAERQERYAALAKANSISEWRLAPDGTLIQAPSWALEAREESPDNPHCWLNQVHPDDVLGLTAVWEELLRLGVGADYCFRARHLSGEYRWVHGRVVPLKNADGSVREWVGTTEDVHEKRETSEQLRLNEKRLRLALSAGRMFTWDFDVKTGQVTRSESAEELLGFGSGHVSQIEGFIHPADWDLLKAALERTVATGAPFELEYRVPSGRDETRWLHARGKLVATGIDAPHRVLGVTMEITDRKRAEQKQIEDRKVIERFEALTQIAGDFIWTATPDGRVDDMPEWRELTGQKIAEVRGWGWLSAVHPGDRERVHQALLRQSDSSTPLEIEYRVRSRSGQYRPFKSRSAPVCRAEGSISEWIGVCTELSERGLGRIDGERTQQPIAPSERETTTGYQVRAARAILRWSVRDLAERSGVSPSTIRRIEDAESGPDASDRRTLRLIRSTLEEAGVRFGPIAGGNCGVAPA